MTVAIILSIVSLFLWILTAFTLKGVDWILISGVNTLPKEEKRKFKEKYDVVAMNKYAGKNIFLPTAVLCTLIVLLIFLGAEWKQSAPVLFAVIMTVISVALIVYLVYLFRATFKILDFEKWRI